MHSECKFVSWWGARLAKTTEDLLLRYKLSLLQMSSPIPLSFLLHSPKINGLHWEIVNIVINMKTHELILGSWEMVMKFIIQGLGCSFHAL